MRFMIMVRANQDTEADVKPEESLIAEMASITKNWPRQGR